MTRTKSQSNSADFPADATHCDVTVDKKAAKALASATEKYGHLIPTVIFRAGDGKHLLVRIHCTVPGCKAERIVATSDLFQCRTCVDHKGWDKDAAPKAKAPKAEKAPRKGSKSKDAPKGTRKAPAQKKATPRARKGKRIQSREDFIAAATGKGE